jgi:cytochrome c-type biogenesis protein CcmE
VSALSARRLVVLAALALAVGIGALAAQQLGASTVYYLTPTEAEQRRLPVGATARLGGLVEKGTLTFDPATLALRFAITDGVTSVTVIGTGAPPGQLREGAGAVVEGAFAQDGTFRASQVLAKHDEVYVAPTPGEAPRLRTAP